MRRVLVVANQTVDDDKLLEVVESLVAHEPAIVELVVPVTPLTEQEASLRHSEHLARPAGETGAVTLARQRLGRAVDKFAAAGIAVEGDLGDPNPVKSVAAVLAVHAVNVIVIATLPRRRSRWTANRVPERLHRKYGIPVLHVETETKVSRARRHIPQTRPAAPFGHASHR